MNLVVESIGHFLRIGMIGAEGSPFGVRRSLLPHLIEVADMGSHGGG